MFTQDALVKSLMRFMESEYHLSLIVRTYRTIKVSCAFEGAVLVLVRVLVPGPGDLGSTFPLLHVVIALQYS